MIKVKLTRNEAIIILALHKLNAYKHEVETEKVLLLIRNDMHIEFSKEELSVGLGELEKLGCVVTVNNKCKLLEKVSININR